MTPIQLSQPTSFRQTTALASDTLLTGMHRIQSGLSRFQAVPIIGPVVGSPIKALVSTAQLVIAVAGKIIFGGLSCCTNNTFVKETSIAASRHFSMGLGSLCYSVINVLSLGIIGYCYESHCQQQELKEEAKKILRNHPLMSSYIADEDSGSDNDIIGGEWNNNSSSGEGTHSLLNSTNSASTVRRSSKHIWIGSVNPNLHSLMDNNTVSWAQNNHYSNQMERSFPILNNEGSDVELGGIENISSNRAYTSLTSNNHNIINHNNSTSTVRRNRSTQQHYITTNGV